MLVSLHAPGPLAPRTLPGQAARIGRRAAKAAARVVLPKGWFACHGPRHGKRVSITFDDGPGPLTLAYVALLESFGARATFFVVGDACREHAAELEELALHGHEIAVHGYSHRPFPLLGSGELHHELDQTCRLLPATSGRTLVRPPRGELSPAALVTCAGAGYTTVLWSRDSGDWRTQDSAELVRTFRDLPARSGDILLFHEGQPWTLAALPHILNDLLEADYELVTVGELLAA
ncbi:MAG TPA: polysaccharide deacetylase family protein [Polyangiaceae bacterium]|nr:polysaccharide deacetylase family protein [Polyangiaceae bacterium]